MLACSTPILAARCPDYAPERLRSLLEEPMAAAVRRVGLRRGDTVLLKPNLLAPHAPERAVCTHPAIVACVGELVRDLGMGLRIGDSPAGGHRVGAVAAAAGLSPVVRRLGAEL